MHVGIGRGIGVLERGRSSKARGNPLSTPDGDVLEDDFG